MATTCKINLTEEQRHEIATNLRLPLEKVPTTLAIVAVSPEAGEAMGLPKDMEYRFAPALIIT
jgi:hypothetical protein